jgi:N-acetylglucosaminyldiphosphoundecaprenol N-acetyl-beta-D-mannosaminyltransferase
MPLVWALRLAGHSAGRVYGPDLMRAMFEHGQERGHRHFLYGSRPETLSKLQFRLLDRYPDAKIVGAFSPPFRDLTPAEEHEITGAINASGADIVWVGLGTPRQEHWMAGMRERLDAPVLVGVGAAFDFIAGVTRQAPRWVQRSGFEWLYRLACEPRRLGRRYAVAVPSFLVLVALQLAGLRRLPIEEPPRTGAAPKAKPTAIASERG